MGRGLLIALCGTLSVLKWILSALPVVPLAPPQSALPPCSLCVVQPFVIATVNPNFKKGVVFTVNVRDSVHAPTERGAERVTRNLKPPDRRRSSLGTSQKSKHFASEWLYLSSNRGRDEGKMNLPSSL